MKKILAISLLFILLVLSATAFWYYGKFSVAKSSFSEKPAWIAKDSAHTAKLKGFTGRMKAYTAANNYNNKLGFLIDMSIESGNNRFFIVNLAKDSIEAASLVTHGRCNENWLKGRKYSNVTGSGCTSLGRYKIGNPYQGKFGLAYKLYGLDSSNSNAYKRFVVLHSHDCVPNQPTFPLPICQSDGCPTVSPGFLLKLKEIINASEKPIILWIYE